MNITKTQSDALNYQVNIEIAAADYAEFWDWAGLEGNLAAALAEWQTPHNATKVARANHGPATASGSDNAQMDVR